MGLCRVSRTGGPLNGRGSDRPDGGKGTLRLVVLRSGAEQSVVGMGKVALLVKTEFVVDDQRLVTVVTVVTAC